MLDSKQPHLRTEHTLARSAITALRRHRLSIAAYTTVSTTPLKIWKAPAAGVYYYTHIKSHDSHAHV